MMRFMENIYTLSLATAALSVALSQSLVFERLRNFTASFGVSLECHFCVSFWVAAVLVFSYGNPPLFVTWLAVVGGSAVLSKIILWGE